MSVPPLGNFLFACLSVLFCGTCRAWILWHAQLLRRSTQLSKSAHCGLCSCSYMRKHTGRVGALVNDCCTVFFRVLGQAAQCMHVTGGCEGPLSSHTVLLHTCISCAVSTCMLCVSFCNVCRQLNGRTRVEVVRDPCHPTQFNPIRPAFPPAEGSEQHMLVANQALQKGEQLGLYWGQLVTHM